MYVDFGDPKEEVRVMNGEFRGSLGWFAGVLLGILPVFISDAEIIIPADAYTENDRYRDRLEFNRKTLGEVYKQVGRRDPKWDEPALAFLNEVAIIFSSIGSQRFDNSERGFENPKAITLGKKAVELGCDDPLVQYCLGAILDNNGRTQEARPHIDRAYADIFQSKYPVHRVYTVVKRKLKLASGEAEKKSVEKVMDEVLRRYARGPFINSAMRREAMKEICAAHDSRPLGDQLAFYNLLQEDKEADRWIVEMYGGEVHFDAAWKARGTDWAANVPPQGWLGFEKHIQIAGERYSAAWKLEPKLPEAALQMMRVVIGRNNQAGNTSRDWFERAISAQADLGDAYAQLQWSLRPRWGGSHQEMIKFGVECYKTGRYDTIIPWYLIGALDEIAADLDGDRSVWQFPDAYEMATDIYRNYAAVMDKTNPSEAGRFRTSHMLLAWEVGKYPEAATQLKEAGAQLNWNPMRYRGWAPEFIISGIHARTGPHAEEIAKAVKIAEGEDRQLALKTWTALEEKILPDDKAFIYINQSKKASKRLLDLQSGEWVNLMPEVDRDPWWVSRVDWKLDDKGRIEAAGGRERPLMLQPASCPDNYEISAKMELSEAAMKQGANAGLTISYLIDPFYQPQSGVWLYPAQKNVWLLSNRASNSKKMELQPVNTVQMRVRGNRATIVINGKELEETINGIQHRRGIPIVGFGPYQGPPGVIVYFSDIKMRWPKKNAE
jgi:tetratricopeptide (TPR) repeat protein